MLSEFAGAAYEMKDAVLTNPYHADGMARDLDFALRMPLDERKTRHARSLAVVERTTAQSWAMSFLDALSECPARELDPSKFTKIDRLANRTIVLPDGGEYEILSRQNIAYAAPAGEKDGKIRGALTINQPEQFWKNSRFLIIVRS